MKTKYGVGIVGAGNIAFHLKVRLEHMGHEVLFMIRSASYICGEKEHPRNDLTLGEMFEKMMIPVPQAVFIAIPTINEYHALGNFGKAALGYILDCMKLGIPVITCEKGAFAYYYRDLLPSIDKIGFTATVGGGTQMLKYLRDRRVDTQNDVRIDAVLNGTLNFIFDEVARGGRTLGEACEEAMHLGYAEPGAKTPQGLINGEMSDIVMKACVVFNAAIAKTTFIAPGVLEDPYLTEEEVQKLGEKAGRYRFVVSFCKNHKATPRFLKSTHFEEHIDGWHVYGGLRDLHGEPEILSWLPSGVGNAVHITEGGLGAGGKYLLTGPGAGLEPTTTAMINDMLLLLEKK